MALKLIPSENGMPTYTEKQEQYSRCCDCGLVHLFRIRAVGEEFELTAYRDDYLTKLAKKQKRKRKRTK